MLDAGLFCNWLAHYRRLRLPIREVYAVAHGGEDVVERLRASGLDSRNILPPPRMAGINTSVAGVPGQHVVGNFASVAFYALNTAKIKVVIDLLKRSRRPVIFSDIDTVWLRDPRGVLSDLPISKAFAIAPETEALPQAGASFTARGGGFHVCACLFAACPSAAGEAIAEAWWHASGGENGRGNEQKAFQQMLNRQPELVVGDAAAASNYSRGGANLGRVDAVSGQFVGASMQARAESNRTRAGLLAGALADTVAILDHAHFPTGRHDRKPAPEAVWLHANWIMRKTRASTTTAKRSRMLKHGLWRPECTTAPVS